MPVRQPTRTEFGNRAANAQPMVLSAVPSEYWRGPGRSPECRPVMTTGATRRPERNAEASTTQQITWGQRLARRQGAGREQPGNAVGQRQGAAARRLAVHQAEETGDRKSVV